jgi:carbonic anhydrase
MHLSSRLLAPLSALLLPASVVVASCGHGLPFVQSFEPRGIVSLPSFGYDVLRGPLNWHHLDPSYFLCKNGTQVSARFQAPVLFFSLSACAPAV